MDGKWACYRPRAACLGGFERDIWCQLRARIADQSNPAIEKEGRSPPFLVLLEIRSETEFVNRTVLLGKEQHFAVARV